MVTRSISDSIEYRLLQPSQYEEAIRFVFEQFVPHEPTFKCLGFDKNKKTANEAEMAFLMPCFESNLSWCAVDTQQNSKMVGLQLNCVTKLEDLPNQAPTYDESISMGLSHEISVGLELEGKIVKTKQILQQHNQDRGLQLFLLATHNDYKKLGIGSKLAIESIKYGVEQTGCCLAFVTCSSFFTQKIFGGKLEFEVVGEQKYADYKFKGEYVFANMEEPHKSVITYVKKLN